MLETPAGRGRTDTIPHFQRIAKLEEHGPRANTRLQALPNLQVILHWIDDLSVPTMSREGRQGLASSSKVIDMRETAKSKSFLQTLHCCRIILGVDLVEVSNDSLNVRGAVMGHVFTDRREEVVIVAAQTGRSDWWHKVVEEVNTHVIASTIPDDT